jgi:hypothetical protein
MVSVYLIPVEDVLLFFGYQRVRKFIYKATWSSPDVEHFLYLDKVHGRKMMFTARYGIRNPRSDAFAVHCIRKYGNELLRTMLRYDAEVNCMMNFEFWIFSGEVTPWMIDLENSTLAAETLQCAIKEHLIPLIGNVTTLKSLRDFLLQDIRKVGWTYVNGALRAAQVVSVSRQVGIERAKIVNSLQPYLKPIEHGLGKGAEISAAEFLEQIITDWDNQTKPLSVH